MLHTNTTDDFYPRPPRGGRPDADLVPFAPVEFLSTPSARRATRPSRSSPSPTRISIHALREEGDFADVAEQRVDFLISIHALREEGDLPFAAARPFYQDFYPRPPRGGRHPNGFPSAYEELFLSTPSARRATLAVTAQTCSSSYFYPRPPRGGRLMMLCSSVSAILFLSTPSARRATGAANRSATIMLQFLSTPSARRATAKTETKSLFSNKLYNILHEFRRALIYNGSKNYPNHAK